MWRLNEDVGKTEVKFRDGSRLDEKGCVMTERGCKMIGNDEEVRWANQKGDDEKERKWIGVEKLNRVIVHIHTYNKCITY